MKKAKWAILCSILLMGSVGCYRTFSQPEATPVLENAQEKRAKQIQLASLPAESVRPDHLNALQWRNIGPDVGSRVSAVAGHPTNSAVFYSGNAYSGVWETTDGGQYWENISDGFFTSGSIGADINDIGFRLRYSNGTDRSRSEETIGDIFPILSTVRCFPNPAVCISRVEDRGLRRVSCNCGHA